MLRIRIILFAAITLSISPSLLSAICENEPDPKVSTPAIFSPFNIQIDPMESLLLVTLLDDPDTLYTGFEPQIFDDEINGKGMLVIAWRQDGYIDVYHQPTLQLNNAKYDIAGKGLANMVERSMEGSYFQISEKGVDTWFRFYDIHNREIEVKITENNSRRRKPFGLLAPMGDAAQNPSAMPMVLLHDFYFVRQKQTEYFIKIDGKYHMSDKLPVKMDRTKMYFMRYSPDPVIATVNPAHNGYMQPVSLNDKTDFDVKTERVHLLRKEDRTRIHSISRDYKDHTVMMTFDPPFPNITEIKQGEEIRGKFRIYGDRSTGKVSGVYSIKEKDGEIFIEMNPSGGWKPRPDKFSLRMMYTFAGVFKNWPKTYYWKARIYFEDNQHPFMQSYWERK